jgi:hypothetical protein
MSMTDQVLLEPAARDCTGTRSRGRRAMSEEEVAAEIMAARESPIISVPAK